MESLLGQNRCENLGRRVGPIRKGVAVDDGQLRECHFHNKVENGDEGAGRGQRRVEIDKICKLMTNSYSSLITIKFITFPACRSPTTTRPSPITTNSIYAGMSPPSTTSTPRNKSWTGRMLTTKTNPSRENSRPQPNINPVSWTSRLSP